jgi:hypothetical protein
MDSANTAEPDRAPELFGTAFAAPLVEASDFELAEFLEHYITPPHQWRGSDNLEY